MTIEERKQTLLERFQRIAARVATGDPNDFDTQLPLTLVSFAPEEQSMLCCFPVESRFGNPYGIAHGGIIATMLDIAQGAAIAAYAESDCRIATVSLQLSYLKPVRIGAPLYVRTKINELGETMAFCAAEAWQEERVLTTSAASVYHLRRNET